MRSICTAAPALIAALLCLAGNAPAADSLRIVATTPDLAEIAAAVGGDAVQVSALLEGPDNPHFVRTRSEFLRQLLGADLLIVNGLMLEARWLPGVLRSARNPAFRRGGSRRLDASAAITALEVPSSLPDPGDPNVHPAGNPHYLADPVNGLRVASLIRERLAELWPEHAKTFADGEAEFRRASVAALVGQPLLDRHGPELLAEHLKNENLGSLLGDGDERGGWLGAMAPHAGARFVQDHAQWEYFARRFDLERAATIQPWAGAAVSADRIAEMVSGIRAENVPIILMCGFIDEANTRSIATRSGSRAVPLAHQAGARPGAAGYLGAVDFNIRSVAGAL